MTSQICVVAFCVAYAFGTYRVLHNNKTARISYLFWSKVTRSTSEIHLIPDDDEDDDEENMTNAAMLATHGKFMTNLATLSESEFWTKFSAFIADAKSFGKEGVEIYLDSVMKQFWPGYKELVTIIDYIHPATFSRSNPVGQFRNLVTDPRFQQLKTQFQEMATRTMKDIVQKVKEIVNQVKEKANDIVKTV